VKGKLPLLQFFFKSGGATSIQTLTWSNKAGQFGATVINMPNALVGIDPRQATQTVTVRFTVSPEHSQQYIGTTTFDLQKVSDTEFKH
jgi:hypothetical protein